MLCLCLQLTTLYLQTKLMIKTLFNLTLVTLCIKFNDKGETIDLK